MSIRRWNPLAVCTQTTAEVHERQRVGRVYRDGKRWVKTAARVASTSPFGV